MTDFEIIDDSAAHAPGCPCCTPAAVADPDSVPGVAVYDETVPDVPTYDETVYDETAWAGSPEAGASYTAGTDIYDPATNYTEPAYAQPSEVPSVAVAGAADPTYVEPAYAEPEPAPIELAPPLTAQGYVGGSPNLGMTIEPAPASGGAPESIGYVGGAPANLGMTLVPGPAVPLQPIEPIQLSGVPVESHEAFPQDGVGPDDIGNEMAKRLAANTVNVLEIERQREALNEMNRNRPY